MSRVTLVYRASLFVRLRVFALVSALLLDNNMSSRVRALMLKWNGARVGARTVVRSSMRVQESFDFDLGDDVFINAGCTLDVSAPIWIGDRVNFGHGVTLVTGGHDIGPPEERCGPHRATAIRIGNGVWLGAGCIILPGVDVGDGSVVAAGAVVARDVAPNSLVGGVPARVIRELGDRA